MTLSMIRCLLALIMLSACSICLAQKLLVHESWHREAIYKVGDEISIWIKNNESMYTATITGFQDSLIVFHDDTVNVSQITHVFVDKKIRRWYFMKYKWEKLFLYLGIGYPLLELINHGSVDKETLIIGGSLVAAGLLARKLISQRIRIEGKRKVVIMYPIKQSATPP